MKLIKSVESMVEFGKKSKNSDVLEQALDLQSSLMELIEKSRKLADKIRELEKENNGLTRSMPVRESVFKKMDTYFIQDDSGNEIGPYCVKCYDSDKKLNSLEVLDNGLAICPLCNKGHTYLM